jgi:tyrosine-specific transport protein
MKAVSQTKGVDARVISATLMVLGTSIGAGMLGLPVETGRSGFLPSLALFLMTWIVMVGSGIVFSEILLKKEKGANFITLTKEILGKKFVALTFVFYVLLFYSLITAYIKAIGILVAEPFPLAPWQGALGFVLFFLPLMYLGTEVIGKVNTLLTLLLMVSFVALVSVAWQHVHSSFLVRQDWSQNIGALPLVISSFGFHGTLPSIVNYLDRDRAKVRWAILVGSTLTLLVYLVWEFLLLGSIPLEGEVSLASAWERDQTVITPMSQLFQSSVLSQSAYLFSLSAIITSFFGVSVGLIDFLMDAFQLKKNAANQMRLLGLVYISAFFWSITELRVFYLSLNYGAGISCVFLLIFLPALMFYKTADEFTGSPYFFRQPKQIAASLMLFSLFAVLSCFVRIGSG